MSSELTNNDIQSIAPLELDPDKYRDKLTEWQLTPEQENELLQVLWDIMSTLVLMGRGLDSTQLILSSLIEKALIEPGDMLGKLESKKEFNTSATNGAVEDGKT